MRRARAGAAALALSLGLLAAPAGAASFPPELRFRTLEGQRVSLHFHQGLEALARRALPLAEEALALHESRYRTRVGRVQVVLADVEDDPNGFATPLPYPLVHLRAVAPTGADDLGNYEDWLRLLLVHEMAHVVHLEQARGVWRAGRTVLGRAPFLFPNGFTPTWLIEGLATHEETRRTAFGRGRDPDVRMVLRVAALADELPAEDRPVSGLDRWPSGLAPYLFGQAFAEDLTARFGADTLPRLARTHAGLPLPYLDELTVRKVTGAGLSERWREWRERLAEEMQTEADAIESRGLTASRALTRRGFRQVRPRFGPRGEWIAYTSRRLTRHRHIRLVHRSGAGDHSLVRRQGGHTLAWTPDGAALVFDQQENHRLFSTRSDLHVVDVRSRRVRRLTKGLRAREPDVAPDGRTVIFVRQHAERSELAAVGLDGTGLRELTRSPPGVQWSGPRVSPDGGSVAAARWSPGGWLDVVLVDLATGGEEALTHDRAKDVEPAWTPDGTHVVFRSDRDGVSNLHAVRLSDRALLRLTNVLGGAFMPDVSPDGSAVAFASYGPEGYDVHLAPLALDGAAPASPYRDEHPPAQPEPVPAAQPDQPYRPLWIARPRFWAPYLAAAGDGTRLGALTGGADPLLRHLWGLGLSWDTGTGRPGVQGFYLYDRWRPTLLLIVQDQHERLALESGTARRRERELVLSAAYPLIRRLRHTQTLSLAWRRSRDTLAGAASGADDRGGLEAAWSLSTVSQYPYSISPLDGARLRLAVLKEDPALGSDVSLAKVLADARVYVRGPAEEHVVAARLGGGTTIGRPAFRRSFAVGGFPGGSLFDVVRTNHSVLRGYAEDAFTGRHFAHANLEYRLALAHPQRGWRSAPLFLRHLHGAVFADAALAWSDSFRLADAKTAVGAALGLDAHIGHGLPVTATVGVARGLAPEGRVHAYVRAGLAF